VSRSLTASDLESLLPELDHALHALQAIRERLVQLGAAPDLRFEIELRLDLQIHMLGALRNLVSSTQIPAIAFLKRRLPSDPVH